MTADPDAMSANEWRACLGGLMKSDASEYDPRVIECREALAYHKVLRAIEESARWLSPAAVDGLAARLLGVTR